MNIPILRIGIATCIVIGSLVIVSGQTDAPPKTLQALVDHAASTTVTKFADKNLTRDDLAITLIDMRDPARPVTASFRGNEKIYPASVVKLFFLVAAHRWLEDKKIEDTAELRRALKDMIVDSYNEATH